MSQNIVYKTKEDIEFDEELEKVLDKFIVKFTCALFMDFLGLLLIFLVFDFSFSSYLFGFNLVNLIFEYIQINDIRYPLRAIVGPLCIAFLIIIINILGSILAGIKNKKNPIFYMKGAYQSYIGKIKEAKFKRK